MIAELRVGQVWRTMEVDGCARLKATILKQLPEERMEVELIRLSKDASKTYWWKVSDMKGWKLDESVTVGNILKLYGE